MDETLNDGQGNEMKNFDFPVFYFIENLSDVRTTHLINAPRPVKIFYEIKHRPARQTGVSLDEKKEDGKYGTENPAL